jgi:secretion/DNA translocation related TadE-like protein
MTSSAGRQLDSDRGYATVWVVSAMALVVIAATVAAGFGVAVVQRHRAATAADASSLAAAQHAVEGSALACGVAVALARANEARVTRCVLTGSVAEVVVARQLPGPLSIFGVAVGRSRAGPASMAPSSSGPRSATRHCDDRANG